MTARATLIQAPSVPIGPPPQVVPPACWVDGRATPLGTAADRAATGPLQGQVCALCETRKLGLFRTLDDAALSAIEVPIHAEHIAAGSVVYRPGEPGNVVYTIRSGLVRFERQGEQGARRIVRLAGRGDLIGQEALLQRPLRDEAIACTEVDLCRIPCALIDELTQRDGRLPQELMQRMQAALEDAETWVAELSTGLARRRVLHLLSTLARHPDAAGRIWLPRRDEIGAMLDMTLETASRLVSQLRREGVIERDLPHTARLVMHKLQAALQGVDTVDTA
jgi:CRP/FNR family transcriptional regulator, anaerobic regulatory protein